LHDNGRGALVEPRRRANAPPQCHHVSMGESEGTLPVDFMHEPSWASLVAPMLSHSIDPHSLARLPRRDRDYAYRMVSHLESPISADQTQRWFRDAPSAITAALVGAAKVRDADRLLRGRRLADVAPADADRCAVMLADADSSLRSACMRYPNAIAPWIPRIGIARALEWGHDEVLRYFAEAQSRERWNLLAADEASAGLSPASSDAYAARLNIATEARANSPEGHPVRALMALAEAASALKDMTSDRDIRPVRGGPEIARDLVHYVRALPDELDPDDVIALGAFLFVASPRQPEEAESVMRGLELLRGRCGGRPYTELADPANWFRRTLDAREAEARALLA